jgi:hypothetical protein
LGRETCSVSGEGTLARQSTTTKCRNSSLTTEPRTGQPPYRQERRASLRRFARGSPVRPLPIWFIT